MKRLKQMLKNKKGSFSILFIILTFTGVLIATAFVDILIESWTIEEVQSIMDTSSVSALRVGVNETKLRVGTFEVDKNMVESKYEQLVGGLLSTSTKIKSYRFISTKVQTFTENWGTGITTKSHPQALIDSRMVIVVEGSPTFDLIPGTAKTFYDSRSGSSFEVSYVGATKDGNIELAIRSVSRIVYR